MTALEDLVDVEPGTPIVLASEHGWLQAAGFLVKTSKRYVTLEMECEGKRRGKNKSPRKRYRLSDFVSYEILEQSEDTAKPKRKDLMFFTSQEGKGCGYVKEIDDNTIKLQIPSPDNERSISFPHIWHWMRVGCDGPFKEYSLDDLKEHTIIKRWRWTSIYNPYSKPIG